MSKTIFNQFLNLFWTLLFFAPLVRYWYLQGLHFWWYIFLSVSVIIAILPQKFFEKLTFFKHRRQYEKWKVKAVRWFAQDGTWANKFKKTNEQSFLIKNVTQARQYLTTISMYERYHWMCLVFFFLSSVHAFMQGWFFLGALTMLANILYNWASLMLQQYNKLRISSFR